jgi:hypothetical protein
MPLALSLPSIRSNDAAEVGDDVEDEDDDDDTASIAVGGADDTDEDTASDLSRWRRLINDCSADDARNPLCTHALRNASSSSWALLQVAGMAAAAMAGKLLLVADTCLLETWSKPFVADCGHTPEVNDDDDDEDNCGDGVIWPISDAVTRRIAASGSDASVIIEAERDNAADADKVDTDDDDRDDDDVQEGA